MNTSPITAIAIQVLSGLLVMSLLSSYPGLAKVLTLVVGLFAVAIWMLRYEPTTMARLAQAPHWARVIRVVCRLSREPFPDTTGFK